MITRTSKIARLPLAVRDELNRRLQEGHIAPHLGPWLNELPEVKAVLAEQFEGRPITAQNLSDWRHSGFEDWCQRQEVLEVAERMGEDLEEFNGLPGPRWLELLGNATAASLARRLRAAEAMAEGPEKTRTVLAVARGVERLQRSLHDEERAARERVWEAERLAEREAAQEAEEERAEAEAEQAEAEAERAQAEGDIRGRKLIRDCWAQVGRYFQILDAVKNGAHRPLPGPVLAFFADATELEQRHVEALRGIHDCLLERIGSNWQVPLFPSWNPLYKAAAAATPAAPAVTATAAVPAESRDPAESAPAEGSSAQAETVTNPATPAPVESAEAATKESWVFTRTGGFEQVG